MIQRDFARFSAEIRKNTPLRNGTTCVHWGRAPGSSAFVVSYQLIVYGR
jgi:hypothetical protein